jgi:putative ABC transport system permease protein
MRAAWRLATSSLSGRRRRTGLLASAVALSGALVVGVACAMESIHAAINQQLAATVGKADLRLRPAGAGTLPESLLEQVRAWREVTRAEPRAQAPVAVSVSRPILEPADAGGFVRRPREFSSAALTLTVVPDSPREALLPPPELMLGRLPAAANEAVLDDLLAFRLTYSYATAAEHRDGFFLPGSADEPHPPIDPVLRPAVPDRAATEAEARRINRAQGVAVGDEIEVSRQAIPGLGIDIPGLSRSAKLRIVGIASMPPLGGRPQVYLTLEGFQRLTGSAGFSQIDIAIRRGLEPDAVAARHRPELPRAALLESTEKVTSGLNRNIQSNQLGMVLATVMAFLSSSFIIMTGLSTAVTERQRELAIVRCIGGTRGQLAASQLLIGALVGLAGALLGVPLGIGLAGLMAAVFSDQLPTGLSISWWGGLLGLSGSLLAGLAGAAWPAIRASRVSPLSGLAARAEVARPRGIAITTAAGLLLLLAQALIVGLPSNGQVIFWGYATVGLPLMFVGYFLLGVPAILLLARLAAPLISRLLRIPGRLLARTIQATPYRHGFTAGALMAGLALMVAIWTNGGSMLRDWLDKIQFPDAFVSGLALPESAQRKLAALDIVADTCAITLTTVETDIFGVRALQRYKTTFVGFDPEPFFRLSRLVWVQGDEATAIRRLNEGGAVIVAREFLTAQGLGLGHRFRCRQGERDYDFEIVGVVASPGLEIVSKFFNVGEDFTDQAVHAVFGSRQDMKDKFFAGEPAPIHLIQVQFSPEVRPENHQSALERIRRELAGYGVLDVGSGWEIKHQVRTFATGILLVFSSVAIAAMLIACFGVANLIVAGVEARRFEFGVLRAIGAERRTLGRLVAGEALLIALTACILGTAMGIQGSWAAQRLYALLLGLDLRLRPPLRPIAAGWLIVVILALAAAAPAIWRLSRRHPRELLGAVRG